MKLSLRLSAAATLVRDGVRVVDVGTDHAYLPVELVRSGKCPSAIACDIGVGPLENARGHVTEFGLGDRIELRLCDGLSGISPDEAEDIAICGMGGELIASILENAPWTKDPQKHYILQPMTAVDDLRRYLAREGFVVLKEVLVQDAGRLYTVMSVAWTGEMTSFGDDYWYIGTVTADQPYGTEYLTRQLNRVEKHAQSLLKSTDPDDLSAREGLLKIAYIIRNKLNATFVKEETL